MTLSCYTLITGLLLPTPEVKRTQGVICYLWRFSFLGAGCVKVCSIPSSSVASYRREHTAGSFSRLNLELCLFWGLFVQQGPYFIGLFSTNNTKRGFFPSLGADCVRICLFTQQQTSLQGTIWLSGYSCWTGGCSKLYFGSFSTSTMLCLYWRFL